MLKSIHSLPALLLIAALADGTHAAEAASRPVRTGGYEVSLDHRSPLSEMAELCRRMGVSIDGIKKSGFEQDYDLAKESFSVEVPAAYTPDQKWGLLVWISPSDDVRLPAPAMDELARRRLILIGARKGGNERAWWCRIGLAIDAAEGGKRLFNIDAQRVFVSGLSGGGRSASMAGVAFADVFHGCIPIIGCNYFRDIANPAKPGSAWRKSYGPVPAKVLGEAKRSRFALVTGEKDQNRDQTKANFEAGFHKDGFPNVTYLEAPGMGHEFPAVEWFIKALDAVEPPAPPAKPRPTTRP